MLPCRGEDLEGGADGGGVGVASPDMAGTTPRRGRGPLRILGNVGVPDEVLVARLCAGDDQALAEIYRCHGALVFGVAQRTTGSRTMGEDVVQEVFCGLWSHPERFDPALGSLRSYLGMTAHRRAVDAVRADARRAGREQRAEVLDSSRRPDGTGPIEGLGVEEAINRAIGQLPEEQRAVVELAFRQGHTHTEIASALGVPEGTVKSRLRLARAKLVRSLADLAMEPA